MRRRSVAAATIWVLMYSLTSRGPSMEETYPTEDACIEAGFQWLQGATSWQIRSEIERRGPNWLCMERLP